MGPQFGVSRGVRVCLARRRLETPGRNTDVHSAFSIIQQRTEDTFYDSTGVRTRLGNRAHERVRTG